MYTIWKDSVGLAIAMTLQENGAPINLTNCTPTLYLYAYGTNTEKWHHNMTVTGAATGQCSYTNVAADFDTVGDYYSIVVLTYTSGKIQTVMGDFFSVITKGENLVPYKDLLKWMDIPTENAKSEETIKMYLENAEVQVNLDCPGIKTSTNVDIIQMKQDLIKLRGAILYFMNSSEMDINPDLRNQKIEMWKREYKEQADMVNARLSSTAVDSSGVVRRVYNSCYTDEDSDEYDDSLP